MREFVVLCPLMMLVACGGGGSTPTAPAPPPAPTTTSLGITLGDIVLVDRTLTATATATLLTNHLSLIADAALAFICEPLHACENRIGIEMRFRNDVRFETATPPAIVEVGRE